MSFAALSNMQAEKWNKLLCCFIIDPTSKKKLNVVKCEEYIGNHKFFLTYKIQQTNTQTFDINLIISQRLPCVDYLASEVIISINVHTYDSKTQYFNQTKEETLIFTSLQNKGVINISLPQSYINTKLSISLTVESTKYLALDWELSRSPSSLPIGIYNSGATCYLNSLIQCLFFIPGFRKIIQSINLQAIYNLYQKQKPENNLAFLERLIQSTIFALQRVFYLLEHSRFPVELSNLIESFHWTDDEITQQHDVHELLLLLIEKLKEEWKIFIAPLDEKYKECPFDKLMSGSFITTIQSIDQSYKKVTEECFYVIPVEILNSTSLEESLQQSTLPEKLEGSNQITLQSGLKSNGTCQTLFLKLPEVCFFQLKRFIYNPQSHTIQKNNSFFSFPMELNLSSVSLECVQEPYYLQSIFIHEGGISAGHYYCYCKVDDHWILFNDNNVKEVPLQILLTEAFGNTVKEMNEKKIKENPEVVFTSSDNESAFDEEEEEDDDDDDDEEEENKRRRRRKGGRKKKRSSRKSRLCLPGGGKSYQPSTSAYILVYVKANQLNTMSEWINKTWIEKSILHSMQLTIKEYYLQETKLIYCFSCWSLNQTNSSSLNTCVLQLHTCWNDRILQKQVLTTFGTTFSIPACKQEWYVVNQGQFKKVDRLLYKEKISTVFEKWFHDKRNRMILYCKVRKSSFDQPSLFGFLHLVNNQIHQWKEIDFLLDETIADFTSRIEKELVIMENIKVSISIEENENHFIALQSFPPTATLRQLGLTNGVVFMISLQDHLPILKKPSYTHYTIYALPLSKYKLIYPSIVLSIPIEATVSTLRESLYQSINSTISFKTSQNGDIQYSSKQIHSSNDIRLFRFINTRNLKERRDWEKMVDAFVDEETRQKWLLQQISKQCGNGETFDYQCGNEIENDEEEELSQLLKKKPSYLPTMENEYFCYYDLVENRDVSKDILYVNLLQDNQFEELCIQTDNQYDFTYILDQVNQKPTWREIPKIGYCVEEGRITEEHSLSSLCGYTMKYQCTSQCYICKDPLTSETPIKCYLYLIEGWSEAGKPVFSLNHIPHIYAVSLQSNYNELFLYMMNLFKVNRNQVLGFYYLNPYQWIFTEKNSWKELRSEEIRFEEIPPENEWITGWEEEWDHPPIFALYIKKNSSSYSDHLHV